jgi:hypothetical protein
LIGLCPVYPMVALKHSAPDCFSSYQPEVPHGKQSELAVVCPARPPSIGRTADDTAVVLALIRSGQLYAWKGPSLLIVNQRGDCSDAEPLSGYYFREARFLRTLRF